MVEARTNEPPLVPLSWPGYLALALAGAELLRVPFWCVVPYSWGGGRFGEIQKFVSRRGGRRLGRRPSAPAGCNKGCGWPNGCWGARGVRGLHTSNQRRAWVRKGSGRWDKRKGCHVPLVMRPQAWPYSIHSRGRRGAVRAPMCPLTPCRIQTTYVPRGRRTVGARPSSWAPKRGHIQSVPRGGGVQYGPPCAL